jgi:hypothetical protein
MPVIADADGLEADVFHCMGSYWVCDRGLFREAGQEAVCDFVFPSLHRFKDGYVAKLLTQHIRDSLPPSANKPIKDSFSAKSCRKGAITQMAMHPDIGIFESCARSGHSTGTVGEEIKRSGRQ